jgi:hypothetical protein
VFGGDSDDVRLASAFLVVKHIEQLAEPQQGRRISFEELVVALIREVVRCADYTRSRRFERIAEQLTELHQALVLGAARFQRFQLLSGWSSRKSRPTCSANMRRSARRCK